MSNKLAELLPSLEQSVVASREAMVRSANTFVVMDDHERVAWKLLPEGRVVFSAIGYDLRPVCMAGSLLSDRLDDFHLMSTHDARDLIGMTYDYPTATLCRLDDYFNARLNDGERLVKLIKGRTA